MLPCGHGHEAVYMQMFSVIEAVSNRDLCSATTNLTAHAELPFLTEYKPPCIYMASIRLFYSFKSEMRLCQ